MRYKLIFNLENKHFPLDYRRSIISFIKLSLSEYNKEYFDMFYKDKDNIIKPFVFAIFFNGAEFKKDEIWVNDKEIQLNISTSDYETAIIMYNAFNNQINNEFSIKDNSLTLNKIYLIQEKTVISDKVRIKFMSPLVVRDRNRETKKDYYYSYSNEKFLNILKINIKEQLKFSNLKDKDLSNFNLTPINAKKTVVKFYEKQIECSLGEYELSANKELIEFLYKSGIGSKHSAGFGMFQII